MQKLGKKYRQTVIDITIEVYWALVRVIGTI